MNTYRNPVKKGEDTADPFVLRYNGRYYLYCTRPGVPCWSSEDLVNWNKEGNSVPEEEFQGLVPFAPEIVYWNGTFYMYTSPHGFGHYVLASDCPTGPFHKITGNIGHNIDISILIDDDGTWYAYWADDKGIMGCKMKSPTEFGDAKLVGVNMHGWTEGPFVIKRDGKYHLTYTGNHYLSKGYRINAAVSDDPLGPYQDNRFNPIVVSTEGEFVGLGHSSTVLGPDLYTYYIIYHNLNPDHTRDMNIDPVIFRQENAFVMGPTVTTRPFPAMPVWRDDLMSHNRNDWQLYQGNWKLINGLRESEGAICAVNKCILPDAGRAEFHIAALPETKRYGLIFPGTEPLSLEIDTEKNQISMKSGEKELAKALLLKDYSHEALHSFLLEYGERLLVYVDGLKRLETGCSLGGHAFGYYGDGRICMGCVTCQGAADIMMICPGSCSVPGDEEILLEVQEDGDYQFCGIHCEYISGTIEIDGNEMKAEMMDEENGFVRFVFPLETGIHLFDARCLAAERVVIEDYDAETKQLMESPSVDQDVEHFHVCHMGPYDKCCGERKWTDVSLSAQLRIGEFVSGGQAGILFRTSQLSDGGEGDDKELGTNFFIGYRICVTDEKLQLWKHRYDEKLLAETDYLHSEEVKLWIDVKGNRIKAGDDEKVLISYLDPEPILRGYYGFHVRNCTLEEGIVFCDKRGVTASGKN